MVAIRPPGILSILQSCLLLLLAVVIPRIAGACPHERNDEVRDCCEVIVASLATSASQKIPRYATLRSG